MSEVAEEMEDILSSPRTELELQLKYRTINLNNQVKTAEQKSP